MSAAASIDRVMGEPVLITPRRTLPKRSPEPDPDRAKIEIVARLRLKAPMVDLEGQRRGSEFRGLSKLQGVEASLSISPAEHPKLPFALREGDLVTLLAPAPGVHSRWSAMVPEPHGGGSLIIPLTRES